MARQADTTSFRQALLNSAAKGELSISTPKLEAVGVNDKRNKTPVNATNSLAERYIVTELTGYPECEGPRSAALQMQDKHSMAATSAAGLCTHRDKIENSAVP